MTGLKFLKNAALDLSAATNKGTHGHSAMMHARACIALLGLKNQLFDGNQRKGIVKLITDLGPKKVSEICKVTLKARTLKVSWQKDNVVGHFFGPADLSQQTADWALKTWPES